jgi:hypothetical protein
MDPDIQNQIGNSTTSSSPFVTAGDEIYFRGTDNKLSKVNSDGSGLTEIGKNTTNSTPFVTPDGSVWFQGTDNHLYKVFNDGTQLSGPGANDTGASPTVVGGVVYFRGSSARPSTLPTKPPKTSRKAKRLISKSRGRARTESTITTTSSC